MKNADLKKIARDGRLNSDAVRVVIFVETMGRGKHEISIDDFRVVLSHTSRRKAMDAVQIAVKSGWLSRDKGGWGSANSYEFHAPTDVPEIDTTEEPPDVSQKELPLDPLMYGKSTPQDPDVPKIDTTTRARAPHPAPPQKILFPLDPKRAREDSENVRFGLNPKVEKELEKEVWNGCRGALKDYFSDRVEKARQWAYLMTVQTWFDGGLGAPRGFGSLDPAKQRLAIASAVNEIMVLSPKDEKIRFASSQGIAGNAATLRTSLEFHLRRQSEESSWPKKAKESEPNGKPKPFVSKTGIGSNQPPFFPEDLEEMDG